MRQICMIVAVTACGISLAVAPREANAAPVPAVSAPAVTSTLIEHAGYWKRRWRHGYSPEIVMPDAQVDLDVNGDVDVETPAIIVLAAAAPVKLRPISLLERRSLRRCALQQSLYRPKIA